jgi:hypothetical protein
MGSRQQLPEQIRSNLEYERTTTQKSQTPAQTQHQPKRTAASTPQVITSQQPASRNHCVQDEEIPTSL